MIMLFTGALRLLGVVLVTGLVSANIYPTSPYSSTVYTAGRMNKLTWVDDGTEPTLDEMDLIKVDLYAGEVCLRYLSMMMADNCPMGFELRSGELVSAAVYGTRLS